MDVNVLLASLEEYLLSKKDFLNGQQTQENLELAKKNFSKSLNEYLDSKADGIIAERKRVSSSTAIRVADVLASAFDGTNMAVIALNNAPAPLKFENENGDNIQLVDWLEMVKKCREWMKVYKEDWYNKIRKEGLK